MTREEAIHAVVQKAYGEVGTREGVNNWNKYAADARVQRLYGWNVQNQPWCCVFANWCYISVFDYDKGAALTYGGSAACSISAQLFMNHGAWSKEPQKGAQIFFYVDNGINHTGIVVDVSGATITTIEGNYSDKVSKNTYYKNDPVIAGYGIPDWSIVSSEEPAEGGADDETTDIIHPMHRRTHFRLAVGDGIDNPLPQVKAWQALLVCWGFNVGDAGIDGEFGDDTKTATELWQSKAKALGADIEENGIVDEDDWEEIIKVPAE